jgi:hypothetical protein
VAVYGPPDTVAAGLRAVAAAGAEMIQLNTMFDHAAQMERLAAEVLPRCDGPLAVVRPIGRRPRCTRTAGSPTPRATGSAAASTTRRRIGDSVRGSPLLRRVGPVPVGDRSFTTMRIATVSG